MGRYEGSQDGQEDQEGDGVQAEDAGAVAAELLLDLEPLAARVVGVGLREGEGPGRAPGHGGEHQPAHQRDPGMQRKAPFDRRWEEQAHGPGCGGGGGPRQQDDVGEQPEAVHRVSAQQMAQPRDREPCFPQAHQLYRMRGSTTA